MIRLSEPAVRGWGLNKEQELNGALFCPAPIIDVRRDDGYECTTGFLGM